MSQNIENNGIEQQDMNQVLQRVARALEGLEYGEVVIKGQGGKVVLWIGTRGRE